MNESSMLPTAIEQHGVLPAEETAVTETAYGHRDADRQRLSHRTGVVLNGQVLGRKIVGVDVSSASERAVGWPSAPGRTP
jgi:hypothetical protein